MTPTTRQTQFKSLFPNEPAFRLTQMQEALFHDGYGAWNDVLTLSKAQRQTLTEQVPFLSYARFHVLESKLKDTYKAVLELTSGGKIETVLMRNRRDQWTICVSSQVGCAMRCGFCATGKMGLVRSLTADEIVDQYRLWKKFLRGLPDLPQRISNIVFMGMGEPLANYAGVKESIITLLEHTDLGPTGITVSTVGVLPVMRTLLEDKEFPHTRIAVSLHSADAIIRKRIVPTSHENFLPELAQWCKAYLKKYGNRRHHLTFEYVMLHNVNDSPAEAKKLAVYVNRIGKIKVNLIPYNFTDQGFERSDRTRIDAFLKVLEKNYVTATVRKTMGDDIAAACGQLIVKEARK